MQFPEAYVRQLNDGVDMLVRTLHATPKDKFTWKPAETARSAAELMNEIIDSTLWNIDLLTTKVVGEWPSDHAWLTDETDAAQYEAKLRQSIADLNAAILAFPEADYATPISLPWGEMTFFDVIAYPYWNLMYHYGQIAYMQTLLGDTQMH